MANRRPPLFELLQKENEPRQKGDASTSRPGVLGGGSTETSGHGAGTKTSTNGHAQGAVESKPTPKPERAETRGTTLDDLSEQGRGGQQAQYTAKPLTNTAKALPKPAPSPASGPKPMQDKGEPRPNSGAADWSGMHPKRTVSVRLFWVYPTVAAVLLSVVLVWIIGYNLGVRSEEAKFEEYLRQSDESTLIRDPIASGPSISPIEPTARPTPQAIEDRTARQPETRPVESEPVESAPEPAQPVVVDVFEDVRQAGNNYLKLASGMSMQRAQGLAEHLTASGVRAMALDEGAQGFGLYTDFPVPSGQYRTLAPQRREHEARVVDLLRTVPADLGGAYTPRDQLWMRFDG